MAETDGRILNEQPAEDGMSLRLEPWAELGLVAGITSASNGQDYGLFQSPDAEIVEANLRSLLASFGDSFGQLLLTRQIHGAGVGKAGSGTGVVIGADRDGHLANRPGTLISITVADCVPVYLAHPPTGTIALLHAGWRGVVAGILEKGIDELCGVARCTPAELLMHCGVSICGACFEVGYEVARRFDGAAAENSYTVDLRSALARRALRKGVEEITQSARCTYHDYPAHFSYRKSGGSPHRMLAFAGVPAA